MHIISNTPLLNKCWKKKKERNLACVASVFVGPSAGLNPLLAHSFNVALASIFASPKLEKCLERAVNLRKRLLRRLKETPGSVWIIKQIILPISTQPHLRWRNLRLKPSLGEVGWRTEGEEGKKGKDCWTQNDSEACVERPISGCWADWAKVPSCPEKPVTQAIHEIITSSELLLNGYQLLLYTTTVDNVFRALWLALKTWDSRLTCRHCSGPGCWANPGSNVIRFWLPY